MGILGSWLLLAAAVWLTAAVLPGFRVKGIVGALVAAAIFGAINWAIGWFLFAVLGIATLGIGFLLAFVTRWIVDAIVLKITDAMTDTLTIDGFGWALIAAAMMSAIGSAGEYLLRIA
jgi:putative membrane protein